MQKIVVLLTSQNPMILIVLFVVAFSIALRKFLKKLFFKTSLTSSSKYCHSVSTAEEGTPLHLSSDRNIREKHAISRLVTKLFNNISLQREHFKKKQH